MRSGALLQCARSLTDPLQESTFLKSAYQKALSKTGFLLSERFTEVEVFTDALRDRSGPEALDLVTESHLAHLTDYLANAGDGKKRSEVDS